MISSDTYEEIYEVLSYMDKVTVMKIPEDILNSIKEKRNPNFKTNIDANNIFEEKNISKEAVDILCYLDYTYWMSNERKSKIGKIKNRKMIEIENQKRKLYNPNNIFEDKSYKKEQESNDIKLIENKKVNLFKKILDKIYNFFRNV